MSILYQSATSVDELFILPHDCIQMLYVSIPYSTGYNYADFYIKRVDNLPDSLVIYIADPAGVQIGSVTFDADADADHGVAFIPDQAWQTAVGYCVLNYRPAGACAPIGSFSFTKDNARLRIGCIRPTAKTLEGIVAVDGEQRSVPFNGAVQFVSGRNIRFRVDPLGDTNAVYIDAVSTVDLQDNCGCGDETHRPITQLGVTKPDDNGNITISGDGCLLITQQLAAILLSNTCSEPCCGCETAEELTEALKPIAERVSQIREYARNLGIGRETLAHLVYRLSGEH